MRIKMPAVRIAQEPELVQDILTCGVCQKEFMLADIVKFIQHKILSCNKENYLVAYADHHHHRNDSDDASDNDDRSTAVVAGVHSRRPSISAPINSKNNVTIASSSSLLLDGIKGLSPPPSRSTISPNAGRIQPKEDHFGDNMRKIEENKDRNDVGSKSSSRLKLVDAESNTTSSEPSLYVCSTCRHRFHSAWFLVQHVQNSHGLRIYVDTHSPLSISAIAGHTAANIPSGGSLRSASSTPTSSSTPIVNPVIGALSTQNTPTDSRHSRVPSLNLADLPRTSAPTVTPVNVVAPPLACLEPHNPFALLRMPLGERQFSPALNAHNPFARPSSHEFRVEQLMSEQFRLNPHSLGLPNPFERPHFAPEHFERPTRGSSVAPTPLALSLEPQLDFYSQRLRQLAGTTSPTSSPSPRKPLLTPPFSSSQVSTPVTANQTPQITGREPCTASLPSTPSSSTTPPDKSDVAPNSASSTSSTNNSINASNNNNNNNSTVSNNNNNINTTPLLDDSNGNGIPAKLKECEVCGKKFRFQSNLEVHRRSHTDDGIKSYQCTSCNYSCSLPGKLRKHIKVQHRNNRTNGGVGNDNNEHDDSLASTPDSSSNKERFVNDGASNSASADSLDEDLDEDDEDEEMQLDEEEEDDDEDELGEETAEGDTPEDLTTTKSTTPNNSASTGGATSTSSSSEKPPTGSLVGELMDKFGLNTIQQYNEAFKQALQESSSKVKEERGNTNGNGASDKESSPVKPTTSTPTLNSIVENGLEKSLRLRDDIAKGILGQPSLDLAHHGFFGAFDNPFEATKRLKLDLDNHSLSREQESLYAGLWLPTMTGPRDLFLGMPEPSELLGRSRSGDGSIKSVSRLTNSLTGPKPGTSSAPGLCMSLNTHSSISSHHHHHHHHKKESRRNDTCEYCGKVFKNCSNLTVHRRSHTGEKPYKCELCSYACAQSSKLTRHMKTHGRLGKDVYRCRFCDMPFSVASTLEKHMRKCVVNQNNKAAGLVPSMLTGEDTGDSSTSAPKETT